MSRTKGSKNLKTIERERIDLIAAETAAGNGENVARLAKDRLSELAEGFFAIAMRFKPQRLPNLEEPRRNGAKRNSAKDGDDNGATDAFDEEGRAILTPAMDERLRLYKEWGRLAMECYSRVVPYESPALRAVVIAQPKTEDNKLRSADELFTEILEEMADRGLLPNGSMKMIEGVVAEEVDD